MNSYEKEQIFYFSTGIKRRLLIAINKENCEYNCNDEVSVKEGNTYRKKEFICPLYSSYKYHCKNYLSEERKQLAISYYLKYFGEEELFEILL